MTAIADGEILYRYADPAAFPTDQKELPTTIFNDPQMSCDWQRLQVSPEQSPHVKNGRRLLVSIAVCDAIRNPANPKRSGQAVPDWKQEIVHDPVPEKENDPYTPNESHSLIKGKKKAAVTTAIRDNSTWRIIDPA